MWAIAPSRLAEYGDVITVPEFQGRGFAALAIQKAIEIIWNEWDLTFAMLFCFPPKLSFYERLGWIAIEAPVWVEQTSGEQRIPIVSMFLSRRGESWPSGEVEIDGLPW